MSATPPRPRLPIGPIVGTAVGLPILTYGIWGLLHDSTLTHPPAAVMWIVGGNLITDLIFLPALIALTFVATRPLPTWTRPTIRLALAISATLALVAYPMIANYGAKPSNPSLLPRNELTGLLTYLALVWTAATATLILRRPHQGTTPNHAANRPPANHTPHQRTSP